MHILGCPKNFCNYSPILCSTKANLKMPVMYKKTDIICDSTSSYPSKAKKLKYLQNYSLEVDSDFEAINARFFRAYQFQYQVSHNDLENRVSGQTDSD